MPWTTGSVNQFADTVTEKGLLGKLIEWLAPNQNSQNIGTGDGNQTSFPIALSSTPVAKGQCRIRYKIGGTVYDAWDDGNGVIRGPQVNESTSVLDNATGVGTINFVAAVDPGYSIDAIYSSALVDGLDWLILQNRTSRDSGQNEAFPGETDQEIILKNSGVSYRDKIIVGIRECHLVSQQFWSWNMNGYIEFPEHWGENWNANDVWHGRNGYNGTWENWNGHPSSYFKDDTMQYWFIANKRRIIVIVRVTNTIYASCYLGFGKRVSTEIENPYPLFVCGNHAGDVNFAHGSLVGIGMPYAGSNRMLSPFPNGVETNPTYLRHHEGTWPSQAITKTPNGLIPLYPVPVSHNYYGYPDVPYLFDLDGVFMCPCDELSVEDTISFGGKDYLVVQDVYRTGYQNYFCVRLD